MFIAAVHVLLSYFNEGFQHDQVGAKGCISGLALGALVNHHSLMKYVLSRSRDTSIHL